jgi:hypothetical protein
MTDTLSPESIKTKQNKRQTARDVLVSLLCLAGAFLCFWLFWKDLNRTMARFAEPIGTITYKRQAAQRRFADRVLWTRVSRGAAVYQGDYVRTAERSEATMHFKDGTDIDLSENSLIQIRIENGENIIDLSGGSLSVAMRSAEPGTVRILVSGENRMELGSGSVVSASTDATGAFTMQVLEGSVSANGQVLSAGSSFSSLPLEERAAPLSPPPDAYFFAPGGTAELRFSWTRLNYERPTKIDLALDRRFRRIERTLTSFGDSTAAALTPGVYWWRVYPDGGALPSAAAGRITVVPPPDIQLISPTEAYTFYVGAEAGTDVRFFWKSSKQKGIPDSGIYLLELADNPAFTSLRLSINVEGAENAFLIYSGLGEGTWYWRVRQLLSGLELPATSSHFSIVRGTAPEPVEPPPTVVVPVTEAPAAVPAESQLLLPAPTGMLPANRFVAGPAQLEKRRLDFSWNAVPGANAYIFTLLEETAQGRRRILSIEGRQSSYSIEDLRLLERGSFVWQVEALRRNGSRIEQRGRPGESRFTVDIPVPENPRVRDTGVLYGQ